MASQRNAKGNASRTEVFGWFPFRVPTFCPPHFDGDDDDDYV